MIYLRYILVVYPSSKRSPCQSSSHGAVCLSNSGWHYVIKIALLLLYSTIHFSAWWGLSHMVSKEQGAWVSHRQHLQAEAGRRGTGAANCGLPGGCFPREIRSHKFTLKAEPGLSCALRHFIFFYLRSKKCLLGKIKYGCYFVTLFSCKT